MPWKFDQFAVDLVWVEENIPTGTVDGASIDLSEGSLELDMLEHNDGGEIDNGERVL